jgi:hypothetical protein
VYEEECNKPRTSCETAKVLNRDGARKGLGVSGEKWLCMNS